MTSKLFPPLFFWELSESSLPLAESLRVDSEDEEGLLDSLGVFLSSPGKGKQARPVIWEGLKPSRRMQARDRCPPYLGVSSLPDHMGYPLGA